MPHRLTHSLPHQDEAKVALEEAPTMTLRWGQGIPLPTSCSPFDTQWGGIPTATHHSTALLPLTDTHSRSFK